MIIHNPGHIRNYSRLMHRISLFHSVLDEFPKKILLRKTKEIKYRSVQKLRSSSKLIRYF